REATNTFLRLLMRVLTPSLFAKKMPSLWTRDNTAGSVEVDPSGIKAGRLFFKFSDVDGYAYCPPVFVGWVAFAMEAMGLKTKSITLSGWSLEAPAPKEVTLDLQLEK